MAEPRDEGADSYRRAAALLDGLLGAGARHAVVSPGSRSTALALAAARCRDLALHVAVDERAAGFFALGLARATGRPSLLIATSGSAPAHWLPAAIEAWEDDQPLVLLSADRPPELLGCGANQATEQSRLFAGHARGAFLLPADATPAHALDVGRRAGAACLWPRPGPVHVNVAIREPLVAAQPERCAPWQAGEPTVALPVAAAAEPAAVAAVAARLDGRRGALLAGRLSPHGQVGAAVAALAMALDCPLIADPLSGLRAGPFETARVLTLADAFLRGATAPAPDWLLRVGAPPVSRALEEWAARCPDNILVAPTTDWADPSRSATRLLIGDVAGTLHALAGEVSGAGVRPEPWRTLDDLEAGARRALESLAQAPAEAALVAGLADALPAGTPVFVANSLVVRDFDSFLPRRSAALPLYANRGVSGIDGNVATAAGIAGGLGRATVAVVGDLALFHDLNALWLAARQPLVIVVVNNAGGAIFGQLAQAGLPEFRALWTTPTALDAGAAAALFGLPFARHDTAAPLIADILRHLAAGAPALLELAVDAGASAAARRAWWRACADAGGCGAPL